MMGGLILYLSWHPASPFNLNPKAATTVFKTKEEQDAFNQGQKDAQDIIKKKGGPDYWPIITPGGAGGGNLSYSYPDIVDESSTYTIIG